MRKALVLCLTLCMLSLVILPTFVQGESDSQLIIINKSVNQLAYYVNGEQVKVFDVATGKKPSYTPEGTFTLVNKIKNRPYYKENIKGGHPSNPLGDRWLGLDVNGTYGTTYAIHGNSNANSIGKYVSAGCIRMHNDDVHWLFDQVKLQTRVVITSSELTFDEIAENNNLTLVYMPLQGDVYIDGEPHSFQQKPIVYKSRTLVPMRSLFELLGAEVEWQESTNTVQAKKDQVIITHKVKSKTAIVNDVIIDLDVGSLLINGIAMIPLRLVTEALGVKIEWVEETQSIHIYTKH